MNCCCTPMQPCPNCGYCPCCGRGGHQFYPYPYQPWYPPQPIWVGGYVPSTTTGTIPFTVGTTTITTY